MQTMLTRLIRKAKTALRIAATKTRLSSLVNYRGHINLNSQTFAIPLGGFTQGLEDLLLQQPSFKTDLLRLAESVANTKLFVDIGANTCQTMLEYFIYKRNGSYFGFEPNPKAFAMLQEINRINELAAKLMPWGCSDRNLPAILYTLSELDSSATDDNLLRPDQRRRPRFIAQYTFDSSSECLNLSQNFIAKIDVEGAECSVLRGMEKTLARHRPLVICEVLHAHRQQEIERNNDHKAALEGILARVDYGIYACLLDDSNRLVRLQKINGFPRNFVYADDPTSCDYLFFPAELEERLIETRNTFQRFNPKVS
jgi:FkbM family methyltransferase